MLQCKESILGPSISPPPSKMLEGPEIENAVRVYGGSEIVEKSEGTHNYNSQAPSNKNPDQSQHARGVGGGYATQL